MQAPRHLLVLDLDGALMSASSEACIVARPHVRDFLVAAQALGYELAVWSASSLEWIRTVLRAVWPTDAVGEPVFVFSAKECTFRRFRNGLHEAAEATVIKRLHKVWKRHPHYTKEHTLILDDTPSTYSQNYGNALAIPTFQACNTATDRELLKTLPLLKLLKEADNVRAIDRATLRANSSDQQCGRNPLNANMSNYGCVA